MSGKGPPDAIARANAALEGKDDPLVPAISLGGDGYSRAFLEALDSSLSFLPEKRPQTVADWRSMFPRTDNLTVTGGRLIESATVTSLSEAPTMVNEPGVTGSGTTQPGGSSAKRWVVAALVVLVVLGAGLGGYVLRPAREAAVKTQTPSAIQIPSEDQVVEVEPAPLETEPETPRPSSALDASQEQLSSLTKQLSELEAEREESPAAAEESPISVVADLDTPDQVELENLDDEAGLRQQEEEQARRLQEEEAKRLQEEIEHQAEIERQKAQLLAAQREQEELERKALEEQMARDAKRQAEEAEREAEAERKRAQALEAELAGLEVTRRQQARVDELLALAEVDLVASRLTTPSRNNALERYREVLDLDEGNAVALEGLERIVVRYVQMAEQATAKGNFAGARSFLSRGEKVLPDSLLLLEAAQATERAQTQAAERRVLAEAERKEREEAEALASQEEELERIQQELARLKAEAELKERLKQQAAAEASVSAIPEPEVTVVKLSNPSRLAIFPMQTSRICHLPRELELRQAVDRLIRNERRLTLSYSYYSDNAQVSAVGAPKQLWTGSVTSKKPNFERVYRVGESMKLDGVFMFWMKCGHSEKLDDSSFPFDVWLVDIERREIFHNQDVLRKFERGCRVVVSEYLKPRQ